MIREPPRRNSGVVGGNFLAKMKLKHPDGRLVTAADIVIGATLTLASHTFVILDADEATLKYMEQRPTQFPYSDPEAVTQLFADQSKLAWPSNDERRNAIDNASRGGDALEFDAFECILGDLASAAGRDVPKQAAITLWRHTAIGNKLYLRDLPF